MIKLVALVVGSALLLEFIFLFHDDAIKIIPITFRFRASDKILLAHHVRIKSKVKSKRT